MRLPSELFYFSGDCTSPETQEDIKAKFIAALELSDYRSVLSVRKNHVRLVYNIV